MGGLSSEREVSLSTGNSVVKAMTRRGLKVFPIDVDRNIANNLKGIDLVFNALHGTYGEDGCIQGGVGSCILEFSSKYNYQLPIKILGVPDKFIPHGTQEEQKIECGIDKKNIFKQIRKAWKEI